MRRLTNRPVIDKMEAPKGSVQLQDNCSLAAIKESIASQPTYQYDEFDICRVVITHEPEFAQTIGRFARYIFRIYYSTLTLAHTLMLSCSQEVLILILLGNNINSFDYIS